MREVFAQQKNGNTVKPHSIQYNSSSNATSGTSKFKKKSKRHNLKERKQPIKLVCAKITASKYYLQLLFTVQRN